MRIFGRIRDAIFGKKAEAAPAAPAAPAEPIPTAVQAPAPAPAAPPPPMDMVDVEAILTRMAAEKGQTLNWRTSIVDLMKLLGMDASLAERKELAQELGYSGALDGSAEMNIWLHKAVMKQLAANGGRVPAELLS
jgi:3-oxoacyl-ACP reductase-like protein